MIDTGLNGRVVLLTGLNHGIGAATARAFAAQGAAVFLQYLRVPTEGQGGSGGETAPPGEALYRSRRLISADAVVNAIQDSGGKAAAWEADLANPAIIPAILDRGEAASGPVQALVNNAAHWESDTFVPTGSASEDWGHWIPPISLESHDRHFAVNSRAVALMMAEFARRHVARGARWGRIINISTDGALGGSGEVSYWASKNALEGFSRSAAIELGKFGITVNIAAPGAIQTGWISPEMEADFLRDAAGPRRPTGGWGGWGG